MYHSEVREETVRGNRDRGNTTEIGSIDPGRGSDSVAETLGVVHGLVGNVKEIMEGAQCLNDCSQVF
jgi:hypothetical protein